MRLLHCLLLNPIFNHLSISMLGRIASARRCGASRSLVAVKRSTAAAAPLSTFISGSTVNNSNQFKSSKWIGVGPKFDSRAIIAASAASYSTSSPLHSAFLTSYDAHVAERASLADGKLGGIAPKPLDAAQTSALIEEIKVASSSDANANRLVELLSTRVPPGVDEAAYVKASYLSAVALGELPPTLISRVRAVELLGTMQGGYNVATLITLLSNSDKELRDCAANQLKHTLLVFDAFHDVVDLSNSTSSSPEAKAAALSVLESWAAAEWYTSKPDVPDKITVTVFKVTGETNTDDLSPAQDAWSRPDIPLHALAMLKNKREGIEPEKDGEIGPLSQMEELLKKGYPLAYVGDVVGTGSSRKSATNSVLWYMGEDIPYVPNIKSGGVCIGGKIAPIFFNTMEDSGALPIEMDVSNLNMGDVIDIYPEKERWSMRHVMNWWRSSI